MDFIKYIINNKYDNEFRICLKWLISNLQPYIDTPCQIKECSEV